MQLEEKLDADTISTEAKIAALNASLAERDAALEVERAAISVLSSDMHTESRPIAVHICVSQRICEVKENWSTHETHA